MGSGDDSSEDSGISGGSAPVDVPGGQPPRHSREPDVESVWLGRRRPPHLGRPRWTTVLMVGAFAGLLVLYVLLR